MVLNIIIIVLLLHKVSSKTYLVTSDDGNNSTENAHTLNYYLMHSNECLTSHTRLQFLPGEHVLQSDMIIEDKINFTLCGNGSVIQCNGSAITVGAINVTDLTICDIELVNCGRENSKPFKKSNKNIPYNHSGALYLSHCTTVNISDVSITTNTGVSGIVAVNVLPTEKFNFADVIISTSCGYPNSSVNGIEIYYDEFSHETHNIMNYTATIRHYSYENNGLCNSSFALFLVLIQKSYGISLIVQDTNFTQLLNSSVLYYYGESCGENIENGIKFNHCSISKNYGNKFLTTKLFHVMIYNGGFIYSKMKHQTKCDTQSNIIAFSDCSFISNINMSSLLYFDLKNTLLDKVLVDIKYCQFFYNYQAAMIKVSSEVTALWQLSHYITITETAMSCNKHDDLISWISTTNGHIELINVTITNNTFPSIMNLYYAVVIYNGYIELSSNYARYVIQASEGSYYLLKEHTTVNITRNQVYASTSTSPVHNQDLKQICYYQFISDRGNLDSEFAATKTLSYKILLVDNIYSAPEYNINVWISENCSWLLETAFYSTKASEIYKAVVRSDPLWANRTVRNSIKSLVCPCSTSSKHVDCMNRQLGSLYPGETLKVKLKIIPFFPSSNAMVVDTSRKSSTNQACLVTNTNEYTQTYLYRRCNEYSYTIWSDKGSCEIHLGPEGIPEVFYVTLKPCPLGFTPQDTWKSCYCDPKLMSFTTSCNLQDQAVLRPPKSWISGRTSNRTHFYTLSHNCPFDYCLLSSSYVNLSTPDQQCQFNRSGKLCGHCQHGFSVMFGTSRCKQCSDAWLLIVMPIAIAGVVLVVMLFGFNLTVTNGVINTFIFYVNIISINFSVFFPKCYLVCVLLALSNLDLGLETCFYNGMDDFTKTYLQFAFPLYLILIACALIIGSRYSNKLQRLTAKRALPVLATLFLLIYTKILLTVCSVLFFFSPIIHLPGSHITFVWSVDTDVPIFGIKHAILFAVCLVLFLILLPFNILLLFPRTLSRYRFINMFKPLLDAYLGPYEDSFSYWMGLQLLMRAVFLGLSVLERSAAFTMGTVILGVLLCVEGFVHPFKSRFKNTQESLVLLNLLAVYVTASHYDGNSEVRPILLQCLIFTALAYFIAYISCHCVMSTCGNAVKFNTAIIHCKAWKKRMHHFLSTKILHATVDEKNQMTNVLCNSYEEFQDSLIAYND